MNRGLANLNILDADYQRTVSLCDELRVPAQRDLSVDTKERDAYLAKRAELMRLFSDIYSRGIEPFAAVVYKTLQNKVSDDSIRLISDLRGYLPMTEDRYSMTDLEKKLTGVMAWPLGFGMRYDIPVKEWSEVAELGRRVVLAFLETGSESDHRYVELKAKFDPLYFSERDRFIADPVLGKMLRDNQYR